MTITAAETPVPAAAGRTPVHPAVRRRMLKKRFTLVGLLIPGGAWLALFFVAPILTLVILSLSTGNVGLGWHLTYTWSNFTQSITSYKAEFLHSFEFGTAATVVALLVSYPAAYWIAFYGGQKKTTYLLIVLLPFYVSQLIRTISWQFILADQGIFLGPLKALHLMPQNFHILATPWAVIGGLTYAQIPYMLLPIFAALERIDRSFIEASKDLYATKWETVRRVVLPLSTPGIFAGVLLVFISATGDYVNEVILGGTGTGVIGNIINSQFFVNMNYPFAAALSLVLMVALLIIVIVYSKSLGTEDLMGGGTY
ncbi:MAG: ABC transporter permease [Actinomycetota bacterium]|nr:ABC transporter permease [Actinomycetota bacterium]